MASQFLACKANEFSFLANTTRNFHHFLPVGSTTSHSPPLSLSMQVFSFGLKILIVVSESSDEPCLRMGHLLTGSCQWIALDNKKPANHCWSRVKWTSSEVYVLTNGAEGRTRTGTGLPTRPSSVRVYQFHHFGNFVILYSLFRGFIWLGFRADFLLSWNIHDCIIFGHGLCYLHLCRLADSDIRHNRSASRSG